MIVRNQREWIRYDDGAYEPVRMGEDIRCKKRGAGIPLWWIMSMPGDWMPQDYGYPFTANHPSGALSDRLVAGETSVFTHRERPPT